MRLTRRAALTAGVAATTLGTLPAVLVPAPASARLAPSLSCAGGSHQRRLEGTLCALAFGQTTRPNGYNVTIALVDTLSSGPTTWSVVAGSLPPD